jgi:hypothetical protein
MADTPHAHLAKLNRRHLLYVVNMVTQRRNFNLSVPKPAVEAVLRALTQAARLLRDHGRLCGHCNRFTEAITKPLPSETLPRTTASAARAAPRPPVSVDANFSASAQGREPPKREPDSQRPMSPASSPSGAADLHSSGNSKLAVTTPHAPATPIALQQVAGKQTVASSLNRSARLRDEQRRREKVYAGKGIAAKYVPTSAVPQPFAAGSRTASFPKAPAPPATARPFTATRPSRAGEEPSFISSSSKSTETMFVRSLFVRQQHQRAAIAKQAEPADFRF